MSSYTVKYGIRGGHSIRENTVFLDFIAATWFLSCMMACARNLQCCRFELITREGGQKRMPPRGHHIKQARVSCIVASWCIPYVKNRIEDVERQGCTPRCRAVLPQCCFLPYEVRVAGEFYDTLAHYDGCSSNFEGSAHAKRAFQQNGWRERISSYATKICIWRWGRPYYSMFLLWAKRICCFYL